MQGWYFILILASYWNWQPYSRRRGKNDDVRCNAECIAVLNRQSRSRKKFNNPNSVGKTLALNFKTFWKIKQSPRQERGSEKPAVQTCNTNTSYTSRSAMYYVQAYFGTQTLFDRTLELCLWYMPQNDPLKILSGQPLRKHWFGSNLLWATLGWLDVSVGFPSKNQFRKPWGHALPTILIDYAEFQRGHKLWELTACKAVVLEDVWFHKSKLKENEQKKAQWAYKTTRLNEKNCLKFIENGAKSQSVCRNDSLEPLQDLERLFGLCSSDLEPSTYLYHEPGI